MDTQHGRVDMLDSPRLVAPAAPQSAEVVPEQRQQERGIRVTAGPSVARTPHASAPSTADYDRVSWLASSTGAPAPTATVQAAESAWAQATDHVTLPPLQTTQTADAWVARRSQWEQLGHVRLHHVLAMHRGCCTHANIGRRTLEERWRTHCLRAIKMRDLSAVEEMRVAYVVPGLADQGGRPVLVVVGGHYRRGVLDQEDLLLHVVKECEALPTGQPFVVLYFNADAPLTALPDADFFRELHAALPPGHRDACKVIYAVHPTLGAKTWAFWLRGTEPTLYAKLAWFEYLHEVAPYFGPGLMAATPDFVRDYDAAKRARRLR